MKRLLLTFAMICSLIAQAMDNNQNNTATMTAVQLKRLKQQEEMERLMAKYNAPEYNGPGMPQESREALKERYNNIQDQETRRLSLGRQQPRYAKHGK